MLHRSIRALMHLAAAAITLLVCGCRNHADVPKAPINVTTYHKLSRDEAPRLSMQKIDSVFLGTTAETVGGITEMRVAGDRYYVLDGPSRRVRVFDRQGRLLKTIGREGGGPGEFRDPMAMELVPGGLLVADGVYGNALAYFDSAGRFVAGKRFAGAGSALSLARSGDAIGIMDHGTIVDPAKQGWNLARFSTLAGDSTGAGCVIDPKYVASARTDGMLSHFGSGALTAADGEFYCTQGTTPVVQVMDHTGKPLRQIRLAPPFYASPGDGKINVSRGAILHYLGTFTAIARYVPLPGGFVSVYTRYDESRGEVRAHLLVCRDGEPIRCGTLEDIGKPVHIPALDTVYVEEELSPDQPVQIGIYRIIGLAR